MRNLKKLQLKKPLAVGVLLITAMSFQSCKKDNKAKSEAPAFDGSSTTFSGAAQLAQSTISTGLIAYWPLSNTPYDLSGNRHSGAVHAVTATTDRFGNVAGAYSFNGKSSYISIPDTVSLRLSGTDFTLNAWVNIKSYNSSFGSDILSKRIAGANNGWNWAIAGQAAGNQGVITYGPGGGGVNAIGKAPVGLNNWHMITSIYLAASKRLKIYVDGVLDTTATNISSANSLITAELCIGRDNPALADNGYFFNGSMSDIRIYNRAITNMELRRLFTAPAAPTAGLIAYWPLTRTSNDLSGNKHNGTPTAVSATVDRFGNPVGAYNFNGSTSCVAIPDSTSLRLNNTDFTLNAWVKLISYDTSFGSVILSKRIAGANNGWNWSIVGAAGSPEGAVSYGPGGGSVNAIGITPINLNEWHMVTCEYVLEKKQLKIYVDGVLDNITVNVASPNAAISAALYIGRDNPDLTDDGYFFHGALNDIRIYNRELSNVEVKQLFNALN